jgi:hypothetical protein
MRQEHLPRFLPGAQAQIDSGILRPVKKSRGDECEDAEVVAISTRPQRLPHPSAMPSASNIRDWQGTPLSSSP